MTIFIHPTAIVEEGAKIGEGTKIWHHCHVRKDSKIGKNCVLGKSVFVDTGVVIGNNCKLQNRVTVYNGVSIADDVFIGPHVTFTNDLYPRSFNLDWKIIPTKVKKGVSISANSTILCGVTLGKYCLIGAGSVVTHDVLDHALVFGNPARVKGVVCYCGAPITDQLPLHVDESITVTCTQCGKKIKLTEKILSQIR